MNRHDSRAVVSPIPVCIGVTLNKLLLQHKWQLLNPRRRLLAVRPAFPSAEPPDKVNPPSHQALTTGVVNSANGMSVRCHEPFKPLLDIRLAVGARKRQLIAACRAIAPPESCHPPELRIIHYR